MVKDGGTGGKVWTLLGSYCLPEDAAIVLGKNHPFLQEVADDLVRLVHHENAGGSRHFRMVTLNETFIISA